MSEIQRDLRPDIESSQLPLMHYATGGTTDSHWDASQDTAVPNPATIIPDYLRESARLRRPVESRTFFLKDSRHISHADQQGVARGIAETTYKRILLTCGTYLMPDVAREIQEHPQAQFFDQFDKRVALTGALVPATGYLRSDAGFNLGMSVAALQEQLQERVIVIMNGLCLDATNVRKDLSSASFTAGSGRDLLPNKDFLLIPAGGTMDFQLDGLDGLVPGKESGIPSFLRGQVRLQRKFAVTPPVLKDSRELTPDDRELISRMIKDVKHEHIVITMGVYKIRDVQQQLRDDLGDKLGDKRVILTASRLPLGITDRTDAPFQLGYALGKVGFVEPGIHVALNGEIIPEGQDHMNVVFTPGEREKLKKMGVIQ